MRGSFLEITPKAAKKDNTFHKRYNSISKTREIPSLMKTGQIGG